MKSSTMTTSVIALCDIPEGLISLPGVGPIDLRRLFENSAPTMVFYAEIYDNYIHIAELKADKEWARFIAVAKNCHEQNVEITNTAQGLILRAIRPIKAHNELFVWIGTDLLSKLEFPFLKPSNIIGKQAYHCHKCGSVFEDPNPLKVHLSFLCKRIEFSLTELPASKTWNLNLPELFPCDGIKLGDNESKNPMTSNVDLFINKQLSYTQPVFYNENLQHCTNDIETSRRYTNAEIIEQDSTVEQPVLRQSSHNLAASVSSNWKSNTENFTHLSQGHVCTFCGKIYSRKYGLKIHVRTHTGYKPLKCKYCFRPFSDPSNLNKHVRLHSDSDAPYRCLKCGKVLVRRRDLDRHMKSRHPDAQIK